MARFIQELTLAPRISLARQGRRKLHLGVRDGGQPFALAMRERNVLIAGDTQSGKSWVAGVLCEQLALEHYCVCVIDPEGEYATLETLPSVMELLDVELGGYIFVTWHASQLHAEVLSSSQAIIVTRVSEPGEARALHALCGQGYEPDDWCTRLRTLDRGYAVLLPGADESGDELVPFHVSARLTAHVRHLQKYLNRRVPAGQSFVVRCNGTADGYEAFSLGELLTMLSMAPELGGHLRRCDLSRWIRGVFDDRVLANRIRALEARWQAGRLDHPHLALITTIRERYGVEE